MGVSLLRTAQSLLTGRTIPHGESDKTQLNITNESQEVSPFQAGDLQAAMNRRKSMANTRQK